MIRSLISALTVWCVGCVVPAPLAIDDTPQTNEPPLITSGSPDFLQAPYAPVHSDDNWNLTVYATDPNVGDVLHMRLYQKYDNEFIQSGDDAVLSPLESDPTQRRGQFDSVLSCAEFHLSGTQPFYFYVYVADVPFLDGEFPSDLPPAGHYDFKYWAILCP